MEENLSLQKINSRVNEIVQDKGHEKIINHLYSYLVITQKPHCNTLLKFPKCTCEYCSNISSYVHAKLKRKRLLKQFERDSDNCFRMSEMDSVISEYKPLLINASNSLESSRVNADKIKLQECGVHYYQQLRKLMPFKKTQLHTKNFFNY